MPSGISSTTTWEGSFNPCLFAISRGIIKVAEILLIKNIFAIFLLFNLSDLYSLNNILDAIVLH